MSDALTPTTKLYFECHITIEPVFDERLEHLKELAKPYRFKVADLLMRKRLADTPERSSFDTFLTGHSKDYLDLEGRMMSLATRCSSEGYKVWRYKIENTLLDVKFDHS